MRGRVAAQAVIVTSGLGGRGAGTAGRKRRFVRDIANGSRFQPGDGNGRRRGARDTRLYEWQGTGMAQTAAVLGTVLVEMLGCERGRLRTHYREEHQ